MNKYDRVIIAGCGALGSNIAYNISSPDIQLVLLDDDSISDTNIPTSVFGKTQIGLYKANALADIIFRKNRCYCLPDTKTLTKRLDQHKDYDKDCMIIDCFDNAAARLLTAGLPNPTIHAGVSEGKTGMVIWGDSFPIGTDEYPRGENPVCTNHLGKLVILTTVTAACCAYLWYQQKGEKISILTTEYSLRRI